MNFSLDKADQDTRQANAAFWAMLGLSACLRVWLALRGHSIRHPDEIFQTLEQAHRLVFGYSIRPWEYREGVRWIGTPLLLTPPMLLARVFALGPDFYVPITRVALALFSLLPFPLFFALVRRRAGALTAALACLLPLFWPETLDFVGSTLSEGIAAPVFAAALCFALLVEYSSSVVRIVCLALLLCLSLCLRFHLAPAILLIAAVGWVRMGRTRRPLFLIALASGLVALAGLDLIFGQLPFQHIWLNAYRNLVDDVAGKFGTEPWSYYLDLLWQHWGWSIVPVGVIVLWRSKDTWLFWATAVLIVATFSAIGHKEYRFYFPATVVFTLGAGWALAATSIWITHRGLSTARGAAPLVLGALLVVPLGSAGSSYAKVLREVEDSRISAQLAASREPDLCGLDDAIRLSVLGTAGFAFLNRDVPLGAVTPKASFASERDHFNYVIAAPDYSATLGVDYAQLACWEAPTSGPLCLYRRAGGCLPSDISRDPVSPEAAK